MSVSTTPATLDAGTAAELIIRNTGSARALLTNPSDYIRPGQVLRVQPGSQPVTATSVSGTTLDVTVISAPFTPGAGTAGGYAKPADGIPATDLSAAVQAALLAKSTATAGTTAWATNWLSGLGNRNYGPVSLIVSGSSTVEGLVATNTTRRATDRLEDALQARFNPGGIGGRHAKFLDTGWSVTGGVGNTTTYSGFGRRSYTLPNAATLARTDTVTGYTVYYGQGPSAGTFTISVDGSVVATITPSTSGNARCDGVWTSATLTRGSHTITFTATSAGAIVNSVYLHDGDQANGVRVYNDGMAGAAVSDFATSDVTHFATLGPALHVLVPGATEYGANTSAATMKTSIQSLIAARKAAATLPPSFLILGTFRRPDVTGREWTPYLDAMQSIADADPANVGYAYIGGAFPASSTVNDPYNVIADGDIHLTDRGHQMLGDLMLHPIVGPLEYPTTTATTATSGSTGGTTGGSQTTTPSGYTSPTSLPGIQAWYDPSAIGLVDGASVDSWTDKGGSSYTATSTSTSRPTYKTQGIGTAPAVLFAAQQRMLSNLPASTSPFTLIFTAKPTGTGPRTILGSQTSGGRQVRFAGTVEGTQIVALVAQGVAVLAQQGPSTVAAVEVVSVTWDGATMGLRINGASVATTVSSTTAFTAGTTTVIGTKDVATNDPFTGLMGDIVQCSGVLSAANIAAEEQRQATKYGVTLG
ncbi:LamG-like jellyroll fold domain-containing protein [Nocardioides kribbensis]|uniref:LamG-like jellyroll fold domain-containing protein n=1 Tax=Nocardioides kribbensis TaxID=305517 RepID=A0ABV1NZ07_9ACTN